MPPRAVLFDFDGVLADTENVHVAAWERTFGALGLAVPAGACGRAAEIDDRLFLAEIFAARKIDGGDIEGWVRRKQRLTVALLADAPRLYPGAAELIGRLQGRARRAIVSTTWRENIEIVLRAAGLADAFELIVGKEDVRSVKPDPEPYALALARMGLPARAAVALEDSATGFQSARAAGVPCVVVGHGRERPEWAGDAPFLPDLEDLDRTLTALRLGGRP